MEENIIIVATYINDITSSYYDEKIFEELYRDIFKFCDENTPIMFIGDFNGRTGDADDTFRGEGNFGNHAIPTPNTFVDLPKRSNCDTIVNSHGKKIIDFCHTFDFKILNGRSLGDAIGNFTHLNANNGESTIDYSICNKTIYKGVEKFMVLPLNEISDHSKIITVFKCSVSVPDSSKDNYAWNPLLEKFKWDKNSREKFSKSLKNCSSEINDISQRIEAGLIDSTGDKLQNLFLKAAESSLKASSKNPKKNWKKRKKSKSGLIGNAMSSSRK